MTRLQDVYPDNRVILREVGLRDGLQLVKTFPSTAAKQRWIREEYAAGVRHFEVGSFLPAKTFPQFVDVRDIIQTVGALPGAYGIALTLNERGVNEALASGVAEVATVVSATEEHSQANANRTRESAIANVKRLCELRDASEHKPIINAAVSMALGCSIVGAVDPKEVLRITEKLFEAGVDMVAIADTVGYAGPKQVGELTAGAVKIAGNKPICIHLHDTRGARCRRTRARRLARRSRRLPVRAGRDRQCRVRGSRVPVREQGIQDRYRYRETGRGARDPEIGNARRGALRRHGPRRIAARYGSEGGLEPRHSQAQCVADHADRGQRHRGGGEDRR
jgi:hydroxymethylglutaryl-CoA lyase